jgi:hypothetical protein
MMYENVARDGKDSDVRASDVSNGYGQFEGRRHTPLQQIWLPPHVFPHDPQLFSFRSRFRHAPLQHVSPAAQALPHDPQWFSLFKPSKHCPRQHNVVPQTWPHVAQLFSL